MPTSDTHLEREPSWRLQQAKVFYSDFSVGKLKEESFDPTVWRLMKYLADKTSDTLLHEVMYISETLAFPGLRSDIMLGKSLAEISKDYALPVEKLELFREVFCDPRFYGNSGHRDARYCSYLSAAQRKDYLLKKRVGKYYEIAIYGMGDRPPLEPKDIESMADVMMSQAASFVAQAADLDIRAPEHKTVLAYMSAFTQVGKLKLEAQAKKADSNDVADKLLKFVDKMENMTLAVPVASSIVLAPTSDCAE